MSTTPIRSEALEYTCISQALVAKDPTLIPLALRPQILEEYHSAGLKLYRTRTAGQVHGDGWRLDVGILAEEGLLTVMLGDVLRLPKKERERVAGHVVTPALNARFLKMRLGMGACTDEGEITAWNGRVGDE